MESEISANRSVLFLSTRRNPVDLKEFLCSNLLLIQCLNLLLAWLLVSSHHDNTHPEKIKPVCVLCWVEQRYIWTKLCMYVCMYSSIVTLSPGRTIWRIAGSSSMRALTQGCDRLNQCWILFIRNSPFAVHQRQFIFVYGGRPGFTWQFKMLLHKIFILFDTNRFYGYDCIHYFFGQLKNLFGKDFQSPH